MLNSANETIPTFGVPFVKKGRGRPPKPKDPLAVKSTDATRGRPPSKTISTNWHNIKDKTERSKQQNIEASRRFRKNKKIKLVNIQSEEQETVEKNKKLKAAVLNLERQITTLKNLMLEKSRER